MTSAATPKLAPPVNLTARRVRRWVIAGVVVLVLLVAGGPPVYRRAKVWRARALAAEAERLLAEGQLDKASGKAQAAIGLAPAEPAVLRAMARVLTSAHSGLALNYWKGLLTQPRATADDRRAAVRVALQSHRLDFAEEQVALLLRADPPPVETLELAADLALLKNNPPAALDFLARLLRQEPHNYRARLLEGRIMASSPDQAQKDRGLRELHKLGEAHDATALSALQTLAQTPDLPAGETSFVAERLAVHPLATTADKLTALALRWRIDPALRAGLIEQAVTQFSKSGPDDLVALGRWLLQQGEAARVLEVIGAAQALTRQELFLVRVDALAALGRWTEIQQSIEQEKPPIQPVYAEVFQARAAKELGQLRDANAHWNLALSHALPSLEQNLYLARYAEKMGEHRVAARAWRQVARTPAWALRANLAALSSLEKDGDTRGLREAVQQLTRLAPNDPAPRNDAAYLDLLLEENVPAASATAEQLFQAHPDVLAYRTTLALAYLRTGRLSDAQRLYNGIEVPWPQVPPRSQAVHAAVLTAAGTAEPPPIPDSTLLLPEERALLRHPIISR
jgi:tetratricopeptide (TPR) repeat protein